MVRPQVGQRRPRPRTITAVICRLCARPWFLGRSDIDPLVLAQATEDALETGDEMVVYARGEPIAPRGMCACFSLGGPRHSQESPALVEVA